MLSLDTRLYLRVQELPDGPKPQPLRSGFSADKAYRALGMFNPSETSDAYFIFSNDRDEVWFICNRHLRTVGLIDAVAALRLPLAQAQALAMRTALGGGSEATASHASDTLVNPSHGPVPTHVPLSTERSASGAWPS